MEGTYIKGELSVDGVEQMCLCLSAIGVLK